MTPANHGQRVAFASITTLFFAWGFITVSVDPLIASLKAIFSLSYAEVMLTQFAFFMAYGEVSLPAAALIRRIGYTNAIVVALARELHVAVAGDGTTPIPALLLEGVIRGARTVRTALRRPVGNFSQLAVD